MTTEQAILFNRFHMLEVELKSIGSVLQKDIDELVSEGTVDAQDLQDSISVFKQRLLAFHAKLNRTESECLDFLSNKIKEIRENED